MRNRPISLRLLSLFFIACAVSFPIQIMWSYEIPLRQIGDTLPYLTDLNWIVMGSLGIAAALSFQASRLLFYFLPVAILLVGFNNYWVGSVGLNANLFETTLATFAFLGVTGLAFEKNAWRALTDRRSHWWRTAPRKKVALPVLIHPWIGDSLNCSTYDISETGAFVVCRPDCQLKIGDHVQFKLKVDSCMAIRCTARLVRIAAESNQHPEGMGLAFTDLDRTQRSMIRKAIYLE